MSGHQHERNHSMLWQESARLLGISPTQCKCTRLSKTGFTYLWRCVPSKVVSSHPMQDKCERVLALHILVQRCKMTWRRNLLTYHHLVEQLVERLQFQQKIPKAWEKSAWSMKYLLTSDNDRTEVDILRYLQNFHTTKLTQLF